MSDPGQVTDAGTQLSYAIQSTGKGRYSSVECIKSSEEHTGIVWPITWLSDSTFACPSWCWAFRSLMGIKLVP